MYILSGDCWFIAGTVCVVVFDRQMFNRVVPQDQSFDLDYAGAFNVIGDRERKPKLTTITPHNKC